MDKELKHALVAWLDNVPSEFEGTTFAGVIDKALAAFGQEADREQFTKVLKAYNWFPEWQREGRWTLAQEKKGRLAAVTYAKVGGPPVDWMSICTWLGERRVHDVVEVDAEENWAVIHAKNEDDQYYDDPENPGNAMRKVIHGPFELRMPAE